MARSTRSRPATTPSTPLRRSSRHANTGRNAATAPQSTAGESEAEPEDEQEDADDDADDDGDKPTEHQAGDDDNTDQFDLQQQLHAEMDVDSEPEDADDGEENGNLSSHDEPAPQPAAPVDGPRRRGRPPLVQTEPTTPSSDTPGRRKRGRPLGSASSTPARRSGRGRGAHLASPVVRVPIDKSGTVADVVNDEVSLPDDDEGETKVDRNGNLLGGRQFRVRTFTIIGRESRQYMLSTEPARCTGFRDSYLFFTKHMRLFKIVLSDAEKLDLIDRGLMPHSYKGRILAVVTARSVFREFGARVVVGGRWIVDDYRVSDQRARIVEAEQALKDGTPVDPAAPPVPVEGELADPNDPLPPAGIPYNLNQYVAWHGASAIYHSNTAAAAAAAAGGPAAAAAAAAAAAVVAGVASPGGPGSSTAGITSGVVTSPTAGSTTTLSTAGVAATGTTAFKSSAASGGVTVAKSRAFTGSRPGSNTGTPVRAPVMSAAAAATPTIAGSKAELDELQPTRRLPVHMTSVNWQIEHAQACARFNAILASRRSSVFDRGVYDVHTNVVHLPRATQPERVKWERYGGSSRVSSTSPVESSDHAQGQGQPLEHHMDGLNINPDSHHSTGISTANPSNSQFGPLAYPTVATHFIADTVYICAPGGNMWIPPVYTDETWPKEPDTFQPEQHLDLTTTTDSTLTPQPHQITTTQPSLPRRTGTTSTIPDSETADWSILAQPPTPSRSVPVESINGQSQPRPSVNVQSRPLVSAISNPFLFSASPLSSTPADQIELLPDHCRVAFEDAVARERLWMDKWA